MDTCCDFLAVCVVDVQQGDKRHRSRGGSKCEEIGEGVIYYVLLQVCTSVQVYVVQMMTMCELRGV